MKSRKPKTLNTKIAEKMLANSTGLADEVGYAMDDFTNVAARMGYGTPSLAESAEYELVRWTNNYWLMITMFRNHSISRRIVEKPALDMTKAWPVINSAKLTPDDIAEFERTISRTHTQARVREALTYGRLFGGAGALIIIDGHEGILDKPLNLDDVNPGSYKGLIVFDRWSGITPSSEIAEDINSPIDFNLPLYYRVQGESGDAFNIHHSRILRFCGPQVPRPENQNQLHWGISVLEPVFEGIRARDNAKYSVLSLLFRAQILAQKNPALAQLLSGVGASAMAMQQFQKVMQAQNQLLSNQSMLLMGADSDLMSQTYSFSGISDVMTMFDVHVAGDAKIPFSILYGRTVTGLAQSNDGEIRLYEQEIAQAQETEIKPQLNNKLYPVICMSEFGEVPDDFDITFPSIRVLTEEQKGDIATKSVEAILSPFGSGVTSARLTLQELKATSVNTGIFTNITDEMITKASDEPEPPIEVEQEEARAGTAEFEEGEGKDAEFNESDHPRDESGKFGRGTGKSSAQQIEFLEKRTLDTYKTPLKHVEWKDADKDFKKFAVSLKSTDEKEIEQKLGQKPKQEMLDPSKLKTVQELLRGADMRKLASSQWEDRGQAITVFKTKDGHYVMDGNHRTVIALMRSEKIRANVFDLT